MGAADLFSRPPVSPLRELGAYEELWVNDQASFKRLAEMFGQSVNDLPSEFVDHDLADQRAREVFELFQRSGLRDAGVAIFGTLNYPEALRAAKYPVQILYYRGNLDLLAMPQRVAVVGTRKPSDEGVRRTRKLVRNLVEDEVVVVSGLAAGIDTVAHQTAIEANGITIGVIGTPINEVYPRENKELQERIARDFLLISQVPVLRYGRQSFKGNRLFFPERNVTMSALTLATIIVEAGETSGTLIQARAALEQKRKLFILDSCFERGLSWPVRLQAQGAIRVSDYAEIRAHLDLAPH